MSLNSIIRAFQAAHRSIQGIKTAPDPDQLPRALKTSQLPFVLTIPGPGEWLEQAIDYKRQDRTLIVRCYIKPIRQGENSGPSLQRVTHLMHAFGEKYLEDITLGGAVDHISWPVGDGGMEPLEYAGSFYHGFEIHVDVVEKIPYRWWDPDNEGLCVWGAWRARNAPDYATSLVDQSPRENDLAAGVAPPWTAAGGWDCNGTTQYLITTFVPTADQFQSILVQFSNSATDGGIILGCQTFAAGVFTWFCIYPESEGTAAYGNGAFGTNAPPLTTGNLAIAGGAGYRDGVLDAAIGPSAIVHTYPVFIGALNEVGNPGSFCDVSIHAVAIYDCILTAAQIARVATAMAAL